MLPSALNSVYVQPCQRSSLKVRVCLQISELPRKDLREPIGSVPWRNFNGGMAMLIGCLSRLLLIFPSRSSRPGEVLMTRTFAHITGKNCVNSGVFRLYGNSI